MYDREVLNKAVHIDTVLRLDLLDVPLHPVKIQVNPIRYKIDVGEKRREKREKKNKKIK